MRFADLTGRLLRPADRLVAALSDPARRERAALLVLAAYTIVWALYGAVAKSSQDVHFDMGEAVAISRELDWGYAKHPPLSAWLVRAWFGLFPLADWSYYLLAMVVAAAGLWCAWKLAAHYLDAEKRVLALALLTFIPFFNFHALKYNANTVLIPLWAAATWWFLRSFETRGMVYAALAGVAAAAAMLGKYWSVMLLAGLALAALADPRRKIYFASAAPWVTVAAGAIVLAPHMVWIATQGFSALGYAVESHPAASYGDAALTGVTYIAGGIGYAAVAILLLLAAARPNLPALVDMLWPREPARRTVLLAFLVPMLLPTLAAVASKAQVVSLWSMGAMTLLPVVLLSSPRVTIARRATVHVVALAMAFPLLMLALSPLIAHVIHQRGVPKGQAHFRLLAAEMERTWRTATGQPLRFVGGDTVLAFGTAFYLSDRPQAFADVRALPMIEPARIERAGIALVCIAGDAYCASIIRPLVSASTGVRRVQVEIARVLLGRRGRPERYDIVIVPPQRD